MRVLLIGPRDSLSKDVQESIRSSLSDSETQVITPDSLPYSPGISVAEAVSDVIDSADLVIADVSHLNPNVLYEIGLAHGLRKPTILLVNSQISPRIPSELAHMYYLSYDPDDLSSLKSHVRHSVKSYAGHRTKR